ncbi:MAG: cytochrome c oxidase subunit 3 [Planctomycetota bacterium]|jgi:cytochrome c oxidase subunit 3
MTQARAILLPAEHDRPVHLAHHFDSTRQQFEAAKFGMWMFLATEVLLFGGLFCAYAVFRANRPDLFSYGSRFLDTTWGAINTMVLILSSATMALAVWCAQRGRQRELVLFLGFTLFFAADFMGIKYIEYSHKFHDNLVWGLKFYESPHPGAPRAPGREAAAMVALEPGDADRGRDLYLRSCLSCHGLKGEGLPGLGKPLRTSAFVSGLDDRGLVQFLKRGRAKNDPLNTRGVAMLPRGGNPSLRDQDLMHIAAFVRLLQEQPDGGPEDAATTQFIIPRTVIADAPRGPPGLVRPSDPPTAEDLEGPRIDASRPANAHLFFGIYFGMTGLHGLHVLAGMVVISWLLVRSLKGHFSSEYFTPVDLGGLYWHVVDLIWIFLFPLLYLI